MVEFTINYGSNCKAPLYYELSDNYYLVSALSYNI